MLIEPDMNGEFNQTIKHVMTDLVHQLTRSFALVILVLALLLGGVDEVHAQAESEAEEIRNAQPVLSLGARVGYGFTDVHGDAIHRSHAGANPMIGAFLNYFVTDRLALQPEITYHPRTVRVSSTQQPLPDRNEYGPAHLWRYSMDFIELPVLLKGYLAIPDIGGRFHIFAGPELAVRLNNTVRHAESTAQEMLPAFGEELSQTNVGIVFGGGVDHFIGRRVVSIDARYTWGLTDLVDDPNRPSLYRRGLNVTVGIGL